MPRAVLDTNIVVAARRSKHGSSPNVEIIRRWSAGEFVWLFTNDMLDEYAEKLLDLGLGEQEVVHFLKGLIQLGDEVPIGFFHVRHYPADLDDAIFLLAALNGMASHLVTYDEHLEEVGVFYPEFITCRPLEFLAALRV